MATQFRKATRQQSKLRMTIDGPAGSGKTYTALRLAHLLAEGGPIAVIDTERGSASKYVGEAPDGIPWAFDVVELTTFSPEEYTKMVQEAGRAGYAVLVIDSLSHAWEGQGGALEIKDRVGGNQYTAWRQVTPIHNRMIDSILGSPCHIITTMRSRIEYVQEQDSGRTTIRKVGMAPVQRPGMEYEFDVVVDMDWGHIASVSKTRCPALTDAKLEKPGRELAVPLIAWLTSGEMIRPVVQMVEQPRQIYQEQAPTPTAVIDLGALVQQYGAEAVLVAGEGKLPGTDVEIAMIAAKLEAGNGQA